MTFSCEGKKDDLFLKYILISFFFIYNESEWELGLSDFKIRKKNHKIGSYDLYS